MYVKWSHNQYTWGKVKEKKRKEKKIHKNLTTSLKKMDTPPNKNLLC